LMTKGVKNRPWKPARALCRPQTVLSNFPDGVSVSIPVYEQEPGRNVTLKSGEALDNIAGSRMAAGQALN
jgi:hypothetical protein